MAAAFGGADSIRLGEARCDSVGSDDAGAPEAVADGSVDGLEPAAEGDAGASAPRGAVASEDDEEESDEEYAYRDRISLGGHRRGTEETSYGFHTLIDQVADGIGNYLLYLEEGQRARVYDRHAGPEAARWRELVQQVPAQAEERARHAAAAAEHWHSLPPSRTGGGGSSGSRTGSCADGAERTLDEALGPCGPPQCAPFQEAPTLPDGKPRLSFTGCFESGNLAMAESSHPSQYTLWVDNDVNTKGYTQWFYFGVRGGHRGLRVTFRIVNLKKAGSLFETGMRPVVWSMKGRRGWRRSGADVRYYPTDPRDKKGFHTLSFTYTFMHDEDTVYFAYHYPYTYTYLQETLAVLSAHPYCGGLFQREALCKTVGGIECDAIIVARPPRDDSDAGSSASDGNATNSPCAAGGSSSALPPRAASGGVTLAPPPRTGGRPLAVITARVHPGESNASWMAHGFLLFLLSASPEAVALRDAFDWLIVPMLNPDGVVHGNYRCGLAGVDLNRIYDNPHKKLNPTIWHLKSRLLERKAELFIDFHGHSKKEGVFFYGGRGSATEIDAEVRLLPKLCCLGSEDFAWRSCCFGVQTSKMTTARLVSFLHLGITRAYTVEASLSCAPAGAPPRALLPPAPSCATPLSAASALSPVSPLPPRTRGSEGSARDRRKSQDREVAVAAAALALSAQVAAPAGRRPSTMVEAPHRTSRAQSPGDGGGDEASDAASDASSGSQRRGERGERGWASDRGRSRADSLMVSPASSARVSAAVAAVARRRDGGRVESVSPTPHSRAAQAEPPEPPEPLCERRNFDPMRLELVGPTIGRAIFAAWQLEAAGGDAAAGPRLLDGREAAAWPQLHYDRLTAETAREEFSRFATGSAPQVSDEDSGGSDSNPSGDERPKEELKKIHKRLLASMKKRKPPPQPVEEPEEPVRYKLVTAFGRTERVPIKPLKKRDVSPNRLMSPPVSSASQADRFQPSRLPVPTAESASRSKTRRHSNPPEMLLGPEQDVCVEDIPGHFPRATSDSSGERKAERLSLPLPPRIAPTVAQQVPAQRHSVSGLANLAAGGSVPVTVLPFTGAGDAAAQAPRRETHLAAPAGQLRRRPKSASPHEHVAPGELASPFCPLRISSASPRPLSPRPSTPGPEEPEPAAEVREPLSMPCPPPLQAEAPVAATSSLTAPAPLGSGRRPTSAVLQGRHIAVVGRGSGSLALAQAAQAAMATDAAFDRGHAAPKARQPGGRLLDHRASAPPALPPALQQLQKRQRAAPREDQSPTRRAAMTPTPDDMRHTESSPPQMQVHSPPQHSATVATGRSVVAFAAARFSSPPVAGGSLQSQQVALAQQVAGCKPRASGSAAQSGKSTGGGGKRTYESAAGFCSQLPEVLAAQQQHHMHMQAQQDLLHQGASTWRAVSKEGDKVASTRTTDAAAEYATAQQHFRSQRQQRRGVVDTAMAPRVGEEPSSPVAPAPSWRPPSAVRALAVSSTTTAGGRATPKRFGALGDARPTSSQAPVRRR